MLYDPQEDTVRSFKQVDYAMLNYSKALENLAVIKPTKVLNSGKQCKYLQALSEYLDVMTCDPRQVCPLPTITPQGNTCQKRFLRTPLNILGAKVLSQTANMKAKHSKQEDEEEEAGFVDRFDNRWMMTEEDKIQAKLKEQSDTLWYVINQNWDYMERSKAIKGLLETRHFRVACVVADPDAILAGHHL
ncbi:hypothetical protein COOONC_18249 [Cooperia oncophora]